MGAYEADTTLQPCPGDIEPYCTGGDNTVDINDLLAVINTWGTCTGWPDDCRGDVYPSPCIDGNINVGDLLYIINNWGPCPSAQPLAPEGWRYCLYICQTSDPDEYEQCVNGCLEALDDPQGIAECIQDAADSCGNDVDCILEEIEDCFTP